MDGDSFLLKFTDPLQQRLWDALKICVINGLTVVAFEGLKNVSHAQHWRTFLVVSLQVAVVNSVLAVL